MKSEKKSIDALKMKDQVQAEVLKEIIDLSSTEEIAFYRKAADEGPFADLMQRVKSRRKPGQKAIRRIGNSVRGSVTGV